MNKEVKIHPTAIVEKGAELGLGIEIGPYALIGPKVKLGDGVRVYSHAVVSGRTTIGARTTIWPFASVGAIPQDLKYRGEDAALVCGEDNLFREYANVSIGTDGGGGTTSIGSGNLFMMNTHVAHDCKIGNRCIIANGSSLAGHIEVDDNVVIGGLVGVHQFVKIGTFAMLAAGSMVSQDVPPFVMVNGNRARPTGLNRTGMERAAFNKEAMAHVKSVYKMIYHSALSLDEVKEALTKQSVPEAKLFLSFLQRSSRGICR